jgi:hypothetical protein
MMPKWLAAKYFAASDAKGLLCQALLAIQFSAGSKEIVFRTTLGTY